MSDPRGFRYPLQSVLQRQRWQLDQRRHELATSLRRQRDADRRLKRLRELHQATSRAQAGERLDPVRAQGRLAYLCQLGDQIEAQVAECRSMAQRCEVLRRASSESQLRLEAIEQHRERIRARFVMEQSRVQAALADQEWMANWHQGGLPETGGAT